MLPDSNKRLHMDVTSFTNIIPKIVSLAFATCFLLFTGAVVPARMDAAGPEQAARLKVMSGYMETDLSLFEKNLQSPKPEPTTRDLASAALAYTMASKDVPKAQSLLLRLFAMQDMRADSPDYGGVPWQQNHPEINDQNAIQFTILSLAPLFIKYGDRFPADFQAQARPHLQAALGSVRRKEVPVWYTNIFLMKLADTILLGEFLKDAEGVAEGKKELLEWMRFTRENGISEYDSAVYGGVQLTVLHTLYSCVQDAEIKNFVRVSLDYLWADAAANYFPPAAALSGSSSRTYSFLSHDLNLNLFYYLYGLQTTPPGRVTELTADALTWAIGVWGAYDPPPELLALSQTPTRIIRQRTGVGPGHDRYNFITPDFSLGSSSFFFEHQDRQICLLLKSAKNLPVLSVVLDPFDAPFGKVLLPEGGGHRKITHLRNSMAAVQDGGALLALIDLASEAGKKIGGSVATNVVFPLGVDGLSLDGQPVKWENEAIQVSEASVICLREGRSAVAMRIFHADSGMDEHPVFFLRNDGRQYGAGRLVAYHSRGNDGLKSPQILRSGVLILAAQCEGEESFARFVADARGWKVDEQTTNGIWKAVASGPSLGRPGASTALAASLDLAKRTVVDRSVKGAAFLPSVFSVNGRDLSAELWGAQR